MMEIPNTLYICSTESFSCKTYHNIEAKHLLS